MENQPTWKMKWHLTRYTVVCWDFSQAGCTSGPRGVYREYREARKLLLGIMLRLLSEITMDVLPSRVGFAAP